MINNKITSINYLKSNQSSLKKSKITKKTFVESENQDCKRKKLSSFLTTIPSKIIKLNLPEAGSFNAGILDLGNKILCVYRSNEYEFKACFLNYEYKVIDGFYYKFKINGVTDPRIIRTPDNKVFISYSI